MAELLAAHHLALIRSGAGRTLLRWAKTLPDDVLIDFPDVAVASAITSLLTSGGTTERTRYLGLVARALAERPGPTVRTRRRRHLSPGRSHSKVGSLLPWRPDVAPST